MAIKRSQLSPTDQIRRALRTKYDKRGTLYFEEVKRSSGYRPPERWCDALVFNLYPSCGCEIWGFEIKASRQDLLSELRDPEKANAFKQFCDHWWLVVTAEDVLKGNKQVPDDWGIMQYTPPGLLKVLRISKKLSPIPIDRWFLMSLIQRFKAAACDGAAKALYNYGISGHIDKEQSNGK